MLPEDQKTWARNWIAMVCAAWFLPAPLQANVVMDIPLDDQLSTADVVMVATLGATESCDVGGEARPCARLDPKAVLKRPPSDLDITKLRLVYFNGISELRLDRFDLGHEVLVFMNCNAGGYCSPVHGWRSVRILSEPSLKPNN